jgi:hypothetical protein
MSVADVEQIALKLSEKDRAHLAAVLLESVAADSLTVGDEEVERRERELESGEVSEISYEELVKRVAAER